MTTASAVPIAMVGKELITFSAVPYRPPDWVKSMPPTTMPTTSTSGGCTIAVKIDPRRTSSTAPRTPR